MGRSRAQHDLDAAIAAKRAVLARNPEPLYLHQPGGPEAGAKHTLHAPQPSLIGLQLRFATLSASIPASVNSLRITTHNSSSGLWAISRRMAVVLPLPKLPVMTARAWKSRSRPS
jgi:hypothetical protein